jgi:hypothetical protein
MCIHILFLACFLGVDQALVGEYLYPNKLIYMRFLPLSGETPAPRRTKLPGIDAKLVSDPSVTVCGTGTTGLGDRCKDALQEKAAHAYEAWLEYKNSMPKPPLRGSRSPRERYQTAQREHDEVLQAFQAKQQRTFEILHKEKKEILQRLAKDKVESRESLASDIHEERAMRQARLDEYQHRKSELAREEKELAAALSEIWRAAGREEMLAWEAWVATRRKQLDNDRFEFLEAQHQQAKKIHDAAAVMREKRSSLMIELELRREKEQKRLKEEVTRLRKANEEGRLRSKYAFDEAKRQEVDALRKESDHWKETKAENVKRRAASVLEKVNPTSHDSSFISSHFAKRSNSSMQMSLNAMEEAVLSKQRAADAVREWKRSRHGQ